MSEILCRGVTPSVPRASLPRPRPSEGASRSSSEIRDLPDMMSAKFSDFLTPSPHCPHLELICSIKFPQPPLLRPLFLDPLRCGHHIWKLPLAAAKAGQTDRQRQRSLNVTETFLVPIEFPIYRGAQRQEKCVAGRFLP